MIHLRAIWYANGSKRAEARAHEIIQQDTRRRLETEIYAPVVTGPILGSIIEDRCARHRQASREFFRLGGN